MFRAEIMFTLLRTAKPLNCNKTFTHIEYRAGAVDRKGLVRRISRLSGFQSSLLLIHFLYSVYGPNTCLYYTKVWLRTYLRCDASLSRSARRSFAPLQKSRHHNRSYVWVEALSGTPGFRVGARAIWYNVNITSIFSGIWTSAGEGLPSYT